ncbi:MAG TPA: type II secretion system protein [Burkholderiales bacterium]|nr:type II secretion system protein [Burkholderiales bacterium]
MHGFSLVELAIVLLILGILGASAILMFNAQIEAKQHADTLRTLDEAREAIVGFALKFDRLPCPAAGAATGVETFVSATDLSCSAPLNGFVPAVTLGIGPTDPQGYLVDAWGNRIRYSVSQWPTGSPNATATSCPPIPPNPGPLNLTQCPAFTTAGAMKSRGLSTLPAVFPDLLRVCDAAGCGGLQFVAPAVLVSTGKNFRAQSLVGVAGGADEETNVHFASAVDRTFVAHEPRPAGGGGGEFDDLVIWLSPNILYNRLIAAGAI